MISNKRLKSKNILVTKVPQHPDKPKLYVSYFTEDSFEDDGMITISGKDSLEDVAKKIDEKLGKIIDLLNPHGKQL